MSDVRDEISTLLDERPDLEAPLQRLLEIDADQETWTFGDVPVDSGAFGELVARDIVEGVNDEYRLNDPAAVRAVLDGEWDGDHDSESAASSRPDVIPAIRNADWVLIGGLVGALGFVVLMRTVFSWAAVYREGHIVLMGNDPYFYRYWLDRLVHLDPHLGALPAGLETHDVLMIAVAWGAATLLGGTERAVATVLAWYPVVAAVVVGLFIYGIAVDRGGAVRDPLSAPSCGRSIGHEKRQNYQE